MNGTTPTPTANDARPSYLDQSALSPDEYAHFLPWAARIRPARSGREGLLDEQDALRFMREDCGVEVDDEVQILSLFERTPLGLQPGHFFALMRLTSWAQQGQAASKRVLFTQAPPARTGLKRGERTPLNPTLSTTVPPPQHVAAPRPRPAPEPATKPTPAPPPVPPPPPPSHPQLQPPLVPVPTAESSAVPPSTPHPPPVPDEASKPANPFRHPVSQQSSPNARADPLLGHDPAPNPFKQTKPRVIRPTPIVATATSPASNPFRQSAPPLPRVAIDGVDLTASSSSAQSHASAGAMISPPLPPRPLAEHKPPPPLPPRHVSPLIQAGLSAASQVRKAQQALPPKTFSVIQSSSSGRVHEAQPRLLTGQTAPADVLQPPPQHHAKRKTIPANFVSSSSDQNSPSASRPSGSQQPVEARRSVSEAQSMLRATNAQSESEERDRTYKTLGPGGAHKLAGSVLSPSPPSKRAALLPPTIAPKPSYIGKGKGGLPTWLQEQEELQRSALASHVEPPPPIPETDVLDQSDSAAGIERNNPFFPHNLDDGYDDVPTTDVASFRNGGSRPLGRSKTLHAKPQPPPPPRRRLDSFPAGHGSPLDAGTYAGFKPHREAGGGGLRLLPPSKQKEMQQQAAAHGQTPNSAPSHGGGTRPRRGSSISSGSGAAPVSPGSLRAASIVSGSSAPARHHRSSHKGRTASASASVHSLSNANGLVAHVQDFLRVQDMPPKGQRPVDLLGKDLAGIVERHDWLARASAAAKGRNPGGARTGLMNDRADEPQTDSVGGVGVDRDGHGDGEGDDSALDTAELDSDDESASGGFGLSSPRGSGGAGRGAGAGVGEMMMMQSGLGTTERREMGRGPEVDKSEEGVDGRERRRLSRMQLREEQGWSPLA